VKPLGQVAFEAYAGHVGWVNHVGKDIPPWDDLPFLIRQAWEEAACAAVNEHEAGKS
jgi:hypothetical protein